MSKTVLIVDDDDSVRDSTACMLETMGWKVKTASSVEIGVTMVSGANVILSAPEMKPFSGVDFFKMIEQKEIPFILMSGSRDAPEIAREIGITFVVKPIDFKALGKILSEI